MELSIRELSEVHESLCYTVVRLRNKIDDPLIACHSTRRQYLQDRLRVATDAATKVAIELDKRI